MSDHLGIGIRGKSRAVERKLVAQFAMIFNDSVVNDRYAINGVRVRVLLVRTAMSRPARVADAYAADQRVTAKLALEIIELSNGASPRQEAALKRSDTG